MKIRLTAQDLGQVSGDLLALPLAKLDPEKPRLPARWSPIDRAVGGFESAAEDFELDVEPAVNVAEARGVVGDEVDQDPLHGADHAGAVDYVPEAGMAQNGAKVFHAAALLGNG